jgi:uracil DNA glycosylase
MELASDKADTWSHAYQGWSLVHYEVLQTLRKDQLIKIHIYYKEGRL